jgi:hypothetical protein
MERQSRRLPAAGHASAEAVVLHGPRRGCALSKAPSHHARREKMLMRRWERALLSCLLALAPYALPEIIPPAAGPGLSQPPGRTLPVACRPRRSIARLALRGGVSSPERDSSNGMLFSHNSDSSHEAVKLELVVRFSKVLYMVALHSEYTKPLTFENLCHCRDVWRRPASERTPSRWGWNPRAALRLTTKAAIRRRSSCRCVCMCMCMCVCVCVCVLYIYYIHKAHTHTHTHTNRDSSPKRRAARRSALDGTRA